MKKENKVINFFLRYWSIITCGWSHLNFTRWMRNIIIISTRNIHKRSSLVEIWMTMLLVTKIYNMSTWMTKSTISIRILKIEGVCITFDFEIRFMSSIDLYGRIINNNNKLVADLFLNHQRGHYIDWWKMIHYKYLSFYGRKRIVKTYQQLNESIL